MKKRTALLPAAVATTVIGMLLAPVAAQASPVAPVAPAAPAASVDAPESPQRSVSLDGPAPLTTAHPEGGTWEYGVRGFLIKDTYSDYLHNSRRHGSSVVNGNGTWNRSAIVGAKNWSRSSVHHTTFNNDAFYRFG